MNVLMLIGAVLVVVIGVLAFYGRKIVGVLFRETIIKRYAMKAVEAAEFMVEAVGEVKFKTALEWAMVQLTKRWKIPISQDVLGDWIEWAIKQMKMEGKEIKKENVLPLDHPALKIRRGEFSIGFETKI